jgi:hypothetical protein
MLVGLLSLVMNESFSDGTIETTSRKSTLQIPLHGAPTVGVFYTGKI